MNSYKHSGKIDELIYSLSIVNHSGGGDFYLHLDQLKWINKQYYGSRLNYSNHELNMQDYNFLKPLLESQPYIHNFLLIDPKKTEISHNLDLFHVRRAHHVGNYIDIYAGLCNIYNSETLESIRKTPWISVTDPLCNPDRDIVICRTNELLPPTLSPIWDEWKEMGLEDDSMFVGSVQEHTDFQSATGWRVYHQPAKDALEMARWIAGAEHFIGNQSVGLSLAIGLGKPFWCEARRDINIKQNECYFPEQPNGNYF